MRPPDLRQRWSFLILNKLFIQLMYDIIKTSCKVQWMIIALRLSIVKNYREGFSCDYESFNLALTTRELFLCSMIIQN